MILFRGQQSKSVIVSTHTDYDSKTVNPLPYTSTPIYVVSTYYHSLQFYSVRVCGMVQCHSSTSSKL